MIGLYREYVNHPPHPVKEGDVLTINTKTGNISFSCNDKQMSFGNHVSLRFGVPSNQANDFAIFIANMAELGIKPISSKEDEVRYMFTERR